MLGHGILGICLKRAVASTEPSLRAEESAKETHRRCHFDFMDGRIDTQLSLLEVTQDEPSWVATVFRGITLGTLG